MTGSKPHSPSADRNKQAILEALQSLLAGDERILEIGSGTGQHACHIGSAMTNIVWQPTELAENLTGIKRWVEDAGCTNVLNPIALDLTSIDTTLKGFDVCFSANTLHIVSWQLVQALFKYAASAVDESGKLIIYGPFTVDGQHNSEGNRLFDEQLRTSDPHSGIRDLNDLNQLASVHGFRSASVVEMPANNKLLCWQRAGSFDATAS